MQTRIAIATLVVGLLSTAAWAQTEPAPVEPPAADGAPPKAGEAAKPDLAQSQLQLLRDFDRFEKSLYDVGEYSRRTDPQRAELLFRARSQSQEQRILTEMQALADSLKPQPGGKLVIGDAPEKQAEVVARMRELLKVLQSADEQDRVKRDLELFQEFLKDTNKMIGEQRDIRAETGRRDNPDRLADREKKLSEDAGKLAEKMDRHDAERLGKKSGDSKEQKNQPAGDDKPEEQQPKDSQESPDDSQPKEGDQPSSEQKPGDMPPESEGEKPSDQKPGEEKSGDQKPGDQKPPSEQKPGEGSQQSQQSPESPSDSKPQEGSPQQQQQQQQSGPSQPQELGQKGEPQSQDAPSPQSPPGEQKKPKTPGRDELEQARDQMQRAIEELLKKETETSGEAQQEALAQLQQLKAHLEEILRQLREEEKELMLASLESRLQKIRKAQTQVNAETVRLEKIPETERGDRHLDRSVALSRDQRDIVLEAEHALELLKEQGSSVAFPEALEQMRENMVTVSDRLIRGDTASTTQVIEELIVETLDEMILALQQEMDRKKDQKRQQQQQQQQDEQEPELVQKIAELKIIRTLQNQINRLTRVIGRDVEEGQARDPDQLKLTDDLARRQKRLQQATYDLAVGKNK